MEVVCLCPFTLFEGDSGTLEVRLKRASEFIKKAQALGTDIVQIPSNWDAEARGHFTTIVSEFAVLADLGAQEQPPISFGV